MKMTRRRITAAPRAFRCVCQLDTPADNTTRFTTSQQQYAAAALFAGNLEPRRSRKAHKAAGYSG
jgi:hypothetical protein